MILLQNKCYVLYGTHYTLLATKNTRHNISIRTAIISMNLRQATSHLLTVHKLIKTENL